MDTTTNPTLEDLFGEPIFIYTRAQAIEDGSLVDVTDLASEAGWKFPVALTRAAWDDCVRWDHGRCQDETGRLWDVVWMASCAAIRNRGGDRVDFTLLRVPNRDGCARALTTKLVVHIGPGDQGEPVVTIMLPTES